jgi:hypothetical protein
MSLSNPQKALIKQAQRQAKLDDSEYRDVLATISGCRSTTDPKLGDRAFDKIIAYMEAIYFRKVDQGQLQHSFHGHSAFQQRGYWASKNTAAETSRDRYVQTDASESIARLEREMAELGYNAAYCATIRERVTQGRSDPRSLHCYEAALKRTIKSKSKHQHAENPF